MVSGGVIGKLGVQVFGFLNISHGKCRGRIRSFNFTGVGWRVFVQ